MEADKIINILLKKLNFTHQDIAKLLKFHDELLRYNEQYNLISKSTEKQIWSRHILDSAQIVNFIDFNKSNSLTDLGTGAGFPGIILAIGTSLVIFSSEKFIECAILPLGINQVCIYSPVGTQKIEEIGLFISKLYFVRIKFLF